MNLDNLLDALEMDSIDEGFEYFEQFSALIEYQKDLDFKAFSDILYHVDNDLLADLISCYFEDIMGGIPDDSMEIYTLMSSLKRNLINMAKEAKRRKDKMNLINELYHFRQWYLNDSVVHCIELIDGEVSDVSLYEALLFFRLEKLNEGKYEYDFSDCLDYAVEEFELDEDIEDDDDYEDYNEEDDYLIDRKNPVIDDEMENEVN